MRLNRFLASAGEGSRRSCEELILTGKVTVNGVVCTELATQVESEDIVKVGNRVLHTAPPRTLLLHKPRGFVCTASDEQGRRTVFDLLPPNSPRLFHVGRLDRESDGLLILTNDGDLSLKLTHPRYKMQKEYEVVLNRPFDFELSSKLLHGVNTPEGWAKAEAVHRLASNKVKVILTQGLKRQIRLMFYELGYEVEKLTRTRIGCLSIEGMPPASWRVLTRKDIDALLASGSIAPEQKRAPRPAAKSASSTSSKSAPAKSAAARRNSVPASRGKAVRKSARSTEGNAPSASSAAPAAPVDSRSFNRPAASGRPARPGARPSGSSRPYGPARPSSGSRPSGASRPSRPSGPARPSSSSHSSGPARSSDPSRSSSSSRPSYGRSARPSGDSRPSRPSGPARPSGAPRPSDSSRPSSSSRPAYPARKAGARPYPKQSQSQSRLSSRSEDDPSRSRREGSPRRASR